LEKDSTTSAQEAAMLIYNRMRPGENIDPESAMDYIKSLFLNSQRIQL